MSAVTRVSTSGGAAQGVQDRDDQKSTERMGSIRQRSLRRFSEARDRIPHAVFPRSQFRNALKEFDFDAVHQILTSRGWTYEELSGVEEIMKLRKQEKKMFAHLAYMKLGCKSLECLDEICYPLLVTSIEKSFLPAVPALMTYTGIQADFYRKQLIEKATLTLSENPCDDSLQMFFLIMKQYEPADVQERVAEVLKHVKNDQLAAQIREKFPN